MIYEGQKTRKELDVLVINRQIQCNIGCLKDCIPFKRTISHLLKYILTHTQPTFWLMYAYFSVVSTENTIA